MKKILLILTFLFLSVSAWAYDWSGWEDSPDNDEVNEFLNALNVGGQQIELVPLDGAFGVNMRDTRYPQRDDGSDLYFVNLDSNFSSFQSGDEYEGHPFENVYGNQHIILLGGIEGIVSNNAVIGQRYTYLAARFIDNFRVVYEDISPINVTVSTNTDFTYVSQSNPIYERPYELYVVPRYAFNNDQDYVEPTIHQGMGCIEYSHNDSITKHIPWPTDNTGDGRYTHVWFDLILALPGTYSESGVTYENKEYPLSDADDYSSIVTVKIEWTQNYRVEFNEGEWGGWTGDRYTGEKWRDCTSILGLSGVWHFEREIMIPFSGFSSTIERGPLDDAGSLVITPTPNASNLSLDYEDTGVPVEVADIHFILNHGKNTDPTDAWLFLSASPDPLGKNQNGFVLVHDDAGSMLTSYNSAKYKVSVRGIGDSASNTDGAGGSVVEFEGDETAGDFLSTSTGINSYIRTISSGELSLPHQNPSTYQYSEFQGVVSVEIEETPMEADGMDSGRYTSEIYIHVMTGW